MGYLNLQIKLTKTSVYIFKKERAQLKYREPWAFFLNGQKSYISGIPDKLPFPILTCRDHSSQPLHQL